jgi:hypothetical protein
VCMDWRHVDILMRAGREVYGATLNLVVWNKTKGLNRSRGSARDQRWGAPGSSD